MLGILADGRRREAGLCPQPQARRKSTFSGLSVPRVTEIFNIKSFLFYSY